MTREQLLLKARKRLDLLKKEGSWAIALTDLLENIIERVEKKQEKGDKGDQGEPGKEGIPGPQGERGPEGKEGKVGPSGKPGRPGNRGEKGDPGVPGRAGKDGKEGPRGKIGQRGEKGREGSPDTPQQIVRKLQGLSGDYRLDASAIKNIPTTTRELPAISLFGGNRSSSPLTIYAEGSNLGQSIHRLNFIGATGARSGDGGVNLTVTPTTTTPAGNTTEIQYNNAGVFGASANLTYNATTGKFTQTILGDTLNDFTITGSRTTRQTDFDNLFNLTPTYSWTGAETGVSAVIRSIFVNMTDQRVVNTTAFGGADYFRIMQFTATRNGTYTNSSTSGAALQSCLFFSYTDAGNYTLNTGVTNKTRIFEIGGSSFNSVYTGTGTHNTEIAAVYIDSPQIALDCTTGPLSVMNYLVYGMFCNYTFVADGSTTPLVKSFGTYYSTSIGTTSTFMNYALYATQGHIGLATDSGNNKGKIRFGAGTNAGSGTSFTLAAWSPDTEIYFSGSKWSFDVITATANMETVFNDTATDCDFRIEASGQSSMFAIDFGNARIGIGVAYASITARLHLMAGTATASTAPLKFTSGALLTTAEAGAFEFLTDKFYGTITTAAARKEFLMGDSAITDAVNIVLGTTTGTKIATATTQKLGFWNATPIVQPTTSVAAATFVANTSGTLNDTATWDSYTIGQIVKALRNAGLLA